jgi:hypothetical protein
MLLCQLVGHRSNELLIGRACTVKKKNLRFCLSDYAKRYGFFIYVDTLHCRHAYLYMKISNSSPLGRHTAGDKLLGTALYGAGDPK